MFDPFTLALIGGAAGGLLNKKDPLKGALLGAGAGYTGGALAGGGLLGGGGSAATQTAGLLGNGAASGAGSQAAMLAAQNEGFGAIGQQMLAQAAGTQAPLSTTLMAGAERFGEGLKQVKPVMDAAGTAMQVQSMFQDDTPMPLAQSSLPPRSPMDVSGTLYGSNQLAVLQKQRNARRGLV